MGCAFLIVILGWFVFGIFGMWNVGELMSIPHWATILLIMVMIAVTWLVGDDT